MELQDVIITQALATRKWRPPNGFVERKGINLIARRTPFGRKAILQALCELALEFCGTDAAGVSVRCETPGGEDFFLEALAGSFIPQVGSKAPLNSPCGVCLKLGAPQLFSHPGRHYGWIEEAGVVVAEVLVVPMFRENQTPFGCLWTLFQCNGRTFDQEDVRLMSSLSADASAALQMQA
jgi:GAF domain-containing protein